jgi:hypothetical protein
MAASGDLGGSEKCGTEAAAAACANAEEEVEGAAARSSFSLDSAAAGEARRGREVEARRLLALAPGAAMAEAGVAVMRPAE